MCLIPEKVSGQIFGGIFFPPKMVLKVDFGSGRQ